VRHIVIPAEEVKNREPYEAEIPATLNKLLDFYLVRCRPILSEDSNRHLFPGRGGGAKTPEQLAAQIKQTIAREVGVFFTPHKFRHLAAHLFLDENPGEYGTVGRILNHKSSITTQTAYSGLEQKGFRRLDALIDRHRTNSRKKA
jgi:integrase